MKAERPRPARGRDLPRLHLVTDAEVLRSDGFDRLAAELLEAGRDQIAIHLRGPGLDGRELWEHASQCAATCARTGSWLFVNDRLDVALACGAAGVQLGGGSFPIRAARRVIGADMVIGASVHDADRARRVTDDGADFVVAGTLFRSLTHPAVTGSGTGWIEGLRDLEAPVIGIGGITPDRVMEVVRAGARGVAVIRGIWAAERPVDALHDYLARLGGDT